MKKLFKSKSSSGPLQSEQDVVFLINKMQQQLVSLEKKIDTLISQSSNQTFKRPFEGRHFSKPYNNFRERSFTQAICAECGKECEVPFKPSADRPVYCRECFSKRKGDSSFKGRHDSGFGGETQRRGKGKKQFFRRRKERV